MTREKEYIRFIHITAQRKNEKNTTEKAQATIRALQLKLAKRNGEDEAFLEWLQESPIDKDLVPNINEERKNPGRQKSRPWVRYSRFNFVRGIELPFESSFAQPYGFARTSCW